MAKWQYYNPNPSNNIVGDCTIRAISKATNQDWEHTYVELCLQGFIMHDMPSSNAVWGAFLKDKGFTRSVIPNTCPDCYTISDFCNDYPNGTYLLATGSHLVCSIDGTYFDTWDSGSEIPSYFLTKGE